MYFSSICVVDVIVPMQAVTSMPSSGNLVSVGRLAYYVYTYFPLNTTAHSDYLSLVVYMIDRGYASYGC